MVSIYLVNGWHIKAKATHTIIDSNGKAWTSILAEDIIEIDIQRTRLSSPDKKLYIADDQIAIKLVF